MTKRGYTAAAPKPAHEMPVIYATEIKAIKALFEGKATADQQREFIAWLDKATAVNANPFRPGGDDARRETDLACGRKLVGDWFYAALKMPSEDPRKG